MVETLDEFLFSGFGVIFEGFECVFQVQGSTRRAFPKTPNTDYMEKSDQKKVLFGLTRAM